MLLPRICTSLPKFLPQLFYIFARAICWDQLRDLRKKQSSDAFAYDAPTRTVADGWDCVGKLMNYIVNKPAILSKPFFYFFYFLFYL